MLILAVLGKSMCSKYEQSITMTPCSIVEKKQKHINKENYDITQL